MVFPWRLSTRLAGYLLRNRLRGVKRFPLVLMLEPTFRCNLSCAGCGRIREYRDDLNHELTAEQCLEAVEEAGAPVVSLTGGEPLLHPEIEEIVNGIVAKRRFVYLCTNGLLLEDSLHKFKPSPYLSLVFHLDGLAETHDRMVCREGVFDSTIETIRVVKRAGFQVRTNTTLYKGTLSEEIEELFTLLTQVGVDGLMVAPAFSYEAVEDGVFLSRGEINGVFQFIYGLRKRFPFYNTPIYLEFLAGKRQLACTPWGNPTRNPKGWKTPCYLLTDGHYTSFRELMEETEWDRYGVGSDPRCANCMVHCGFEPTAAAEASRSLSSLWQMLKWNLFS